MDGWVGEWMDGWMDGWMDRWTDGQRLRCLALSAWTPDCHTSMTKLTVQSSEQTA